MPAIIPVIAAIAAIGGVVEAGVGLAQSKKGGAAAPPPLPTAPDPNAAQNNADAAQTRQRQILLATGGQTDYTSGTGTLLGSDIGKATLLGGL